MKLYDYNEDQAREAKEKAYEAKKAANAAPDNMELSKAAKDALADAFRVSVAIVYIR